MGIYADIYAAADGRRDALSILPANAVRVLVLNADGPFERVKGEPAVIIEAGPYGSMRAVPVDVQGDKVPGCMFGGRYVGASDSRFGELAGFYGAVALHDRVEG